MTEREREKETKRDRERETGIQRKQRQRNKEIMGEDTDKKKHNSRKTCHLELTRTA